MKRVAKRFLEYMKNEKNASPATVRSYEGDLQKFVKFVCQRRGNKYTLAGEVTKEMVREFLAFLGEQGYKKKNCAASRARKLATIRSFFKFACREGLSGNNPASDITVARGAQKEPPFLTEEEYKRLLKVAASRPRTTFLRRRNHAIISLFLSTGARLSELVGLDVGDLDFTQKSIMFRKRKGGGEQSLPLSDQIIQILKDYMRLRRKRARTRALFISIRNRRIDNNTVWHMVKKNCQEAKIRKVRMGPHTLRHSFASYLLSKGENIRHIQILLNHHSLSTTARYLHTQDVELAKAVNKISLE